MCTYATSRVVVKTMHKLSLRAVGASLLALGVLACGDESSSDTASDGVAGDSSTAVGSGGSGNAGGCAEGQTLCGSVCVDLTQNVSNCGSCGSACLTGQSCQSGICTCMPGLVECSGMCVDLLSHASHCGACDTPCSAGQVCSNGTCATTCATGLVQCDASCVDINANLSHCGACGNQCAAGSSCVGGVCTPTGAGGTGTGGTGGVGTGGTGSGGLGVGGTGVGGAPGTGGTGVGGLNAGGTGGTGMGGSAGVGVGGTPSAGGAVATGGAAGSTGGTPTGTGGLSDVPWIDGNCSTSGNTINLETAEFCVRLSTDSQTVAALEPKSAPGFDFTPADQLSARSGPGYFHLGDLTLRVRTDTSGAWQNLSTHESRTPVTALGASGDVLAAAELNPVLSGSPLSVTRSWVSEGGRLALRFEVTNSSAASVEVGALGIPLIFNHIITGRSLDQAHATCSFADPYIGQDAGYVQVTRLSGHGPALVVYPENGTPLEAYQPILPIPAPEATMDPTPVFPDPTPRNNTFEGFHEWLVHSRAYAENEWGGAQPWNTPSSVTLAPGESRTYGLRFVLSDEIRDIEDVLVQNQRPVAVGIPGTILPTDLQGKLYLNYGASVSSLIVEPAGALTLTPENATPSGWQAYTVQGSGWGRVRLTVTYADGMQQTIHYYLTKPAAQAVSDLGNFLTTSAWFVDSNDYFGRSPSVMTYDREDEAVVLQEKRAWVCGLGDDGGATWLAGIMKLGGQPDAGQVAQYQQFIDGVVWGNLQYSSGSLMYGVKRTLFYYEPNELPSGYYDSSIDWNYWGAWPRAHTEQVPRSYNYPHVVALYWTMYRLARNHVGLVDNHTWDWYLNQAYETSVAMTTIGNDYSQFGLMDGSIFLEVLKDLQREGMTSEATDLEARMRARADHWRTLAYPFGSEMAWDSTGQEEVYTWTKYFGYADKAQVCVDAILGYMPTVPHWGYNGCARRYWDFKYGGAKVDRLERMLHHYGSSLNAIPILSEYRDNPDDMYLLRIGYGGMMGSLSNIDQGGFPSMAFHSFADTMRWEPRTGDYGLNFFGHAINTATYLVNHPELGWQAFGGNLTENGTAVVVTPLDSFRNRIYVAPAGLWLTLDAGQFQTVEYTPQTGAVAVTMAPSDAYTPSARLRVEQPAQPAGSYAVVGSYAVERGAHVVPLSGSPTVVNLTPQ